MKNGIIKKSMKIIMEHEIKLYGYGKIIYRSQHCMVMVRIKYQKPFINGIKFYLNCIR